MPRHALIPTIFDELEGWKDDLFTFKLPKNIENTGVSLYETENEVIAEAHVPGVQPKDIQVTFEKGILFIKAETTEESHDDKELLKYHMRASSSFSYRVALPNHIDENTPPQASCKDGVLKVTFLKSLAAKSQKIEVKVGE